LKKDDYDNDYDNDNDIKETNEMPTLDSEYWILDPLIGDLSHAGAAVPRHRCRGGCSSGKINVFIFAVGYPHRRSPMSFLIRLSWRLSVLARGPNPAPPGVSSKYRFDAPKADRISHISH
jgi:hypothetical protein